MRAKYVEGGALRFHCPGCKEEHVVTVGRSEHPVWEFNGNLERPTLVPSVLVRSGHHLHEPPVPGNCACDFQERFPDEEPWQWPCTRCHSFVADGHIQFLPDSTHALAGQTVDLPEVDA